MHIALDANPNLRSFLNGKHITRVLIWVDTDGRPAKVEVDRSSGYRELDQVALRIATLT